MLSVNSQFLQKPNPYFTGSQGSVLGNIVLKYTERLAPPSDTFVRQGLRRASSMKERGQFADLFVTAMLEKGEEGPKVPGIVKRLRRFTFQMLPTEIIEEDGKIVGGFAFTIKGKRMCIEAMALDSSKRGTPEGRELVRLMGRRIKQIASGAKVATLNTVVNQNSPGLIKLYEKAGFKVVEETTPCCRMVVKIKDFGTV